MSESVLLSFDQGVASITLNRPDVHNAFDETVIAALATAFDDLAKRDDIHAVVLRGEGKSFSAGADLNWMKRAAGFSEAENKRDALALAGMLDKLNTLPQLTIARVHGAAMGGGLGLVSC
ncbi:MAG TPA: enoyl-CoA hydratase-related protein, partial [Alphaproteobacteria bacterium]|nr:enoyl-CoA hydratase-related protein [Alphaproteobacteria bacterium]